MATTTYYSDRLTKPFGWSHSRLKNFEACPRKHLMVDLLKRVPMDSTPQLEEGQRVHDAIAAFIKDGTPLPGTMRDYYPEIRRVTGEQAEGEIWLVEEGMNLRRDMVACGPFDAGVWMRCKVDFAKVRRNVAIAVDWKTGKIVEDSQQLFQMAACLFAKYPTVQKVRTQYIWLGNHAVTTEDFARADLPRVWAGLLPRVEAYERAWNSNDFPEKPSGLCVSWCQVASCRYHGKGSRG